ncbi:DUF2812 domain-containing protein [Sedimentibacter saalensis]|uniref:DUF2812 domain-containing protein n=1 Tax=Sedimentibacter saalensis TaxID=130788 RepID=UPI00289D3551|nr:DUF2812 domain-containing protein [Sedimentibacter saalensis]
MIKKFRIFLNPIEGQEKWLNEKAAEGLRLLKVGRFFYEFEQCKINQFQYAVDYIGNNSNAQRKEYESFLDEVGINYFEKPLNIGQFSFGKVKYRPYANKGGKLATSWGMINRELLILEKECNGKPFNIYSNAEDKIQALKERRKPHIYLFILILLMGGYFTFAKRYMLDAAYMNSQNSFSNSVVTLLLGVMGTITIARMVQLSLSIKSLKEMGNIQE